MLHKLICIYMLLIIVIWTDAEVLGVEIFNDTHLKLNWYYPYVYSHDNKYFIIKLDMEDIDSNQIQLNITVPEKPADEYTEYIEYNEGIKYYIFIMQYLNNTVKDVNVIATYNITTPIKLDVNIFKCNKNELNITLNDLKISKRQKHLCVSNNDTTIFDLNVYPPHTQRLVKACNIPNNSINCSNSIHLIGLLQLEERNIPLKFNIIKVSQVIIETSNIKAILIVTVALILILCLTAINNCVRFRCTKNIQATKLIETRQSTLLLQQDSFQDIDKEVEVEIEEIDYLGIEHAKISSNFNIETAKINKSTFTNENNLPYEFNRVKLQCKTGFINASYIQNSEGINKYIATTHPQPSTIGNFMKMIWQEKVEIIVMLIGQENSTLTESEYWPDQEVKIESYGKLIETVKYVDFNVKKVQLQKGDECRELIQLQYTEWPDYSIPHSPHNFINFIQYFRKQKFNSPIVVQCSTGVDNTGVFILCDYLLDQYNNNILLDYPSALIYLRKHRMNMVNLSSQYKFCHYVIEEAFKLPKQIPIEMFLVSNYDNLKMDFEYIKTDAIDLIYTRKKLKINKNKNRNKNEVLSCKGFLYLDCYPKNELNSKYINASKIYHNAKTFICTQHPLKETVGDFWRLIDQEETQLILVLQEISDIEFWSTKTHLQVVDYLKITPNSHIFHEHYDEIKLKLSKTQVNKDITLMYLKNWHRNSFPKPEIFINFVLQSMSNNYNKITMVCSDGSEACGIYLSFLKVLEQINLEEVVDFYRAISMLRMYRSDFVYNLEQYKYLYDVTKAYLNKDHEYSTID